MNALMKRIAVTLTCASLLSGLAGCNAAATGTDADAREAEAALSKQSVRELAVDGKDGVYHLGDDTIEIRDGAIRLNRVPYGTVHAYNRVRYIAFGNTKALYVDEVLRKPSVKGGVAVN